MKKPAPFQVRVRIFSCFETGTSNATQPSSASTILP